jgi:hypothetical protein
MRLIALALIASRAFSFSHQVASRSLSLVQARSFASKKTTAMSATVSEIDREALINCPTIPLRDGTPQ